MFVIKNIILLIIFCSCTSIGFLISKKYKDREKELIEILSLINILKNKIQFTKMPLIEILESLTKINKESNISKLFLQISTNMKKNSDNVWENALDENLTLNLKKEDKEIIKNLGNILGKTDVDGQISEIEQFQILIKNNIKNAIEEKNKNEKMYRSLGTIVGIALVIFLI